MTVVGDMELERLGVTGYAERDEGPEANEPDAAARAVERKVVVRAAAGDPRTAWPNVE
jgi:hypothetical protein